MYKIVDKEYLNPTVVMMKIEAPFVARKANPGQFIIFRIDEDGERVPLTIADFDREEGTVSIIFQTVGKTTRKLASMEAGEFILDFVGPLGKYNEHKDVNKVCVIGGGAGTAVAYPQARKFFKEGVHTDVIIGFRNKDLIILDEKMREVSNRLFIATEDGSIGEKGFVTNVLKRLIDEEGKYDLVIAIGPVIMMKVVSQLTKEYGIKTEVSMNPIMIDGTGMCGGCRVIVNGKPKFACVDGPEFDGHEVDFDIMMNRQRMYFDEEKQSLSNYEHECLMEKEADKIKKEEEGV